MLDVTGFRVVFFLFGCLLLGAAWWSWRASAARCRRPGARDPRCARCDYELQGLAQPRCSECGADLRQAGVIEAWQRGHTRRLLRTWLLASTGLSCMVLSVLASLRIGAVPGEVTHVQVFVGSPDARTLLQQPGPVRSVHAIGVRRPVVAADDSEEGSPPRRPTRSESGPMPAMPLAEWVPPRTAAEERADVTVSVTPPTVYAEISAPLRDEDLDPLLQALREVFTSVGAPNGEALREASAAAAGRPLIFRSETGIVAALEQLPPDAVEWSLQEIEEALEVLHAALSRTLEPRFQRARRVRSHEYASGWWSSTAIYSRGGRAGTPLHRPWMVWTLLGIVCVGSVVVVLARRRAMRGRGAHDFGIAE